MNLQERLRHELHDRAESIVVDGGGPRAAMAGARARTRRARTIGVAVAVTLVAGVGGVAFTIRPDSTDSLTAAGVDTVDDNGPDTADTDNITGAANPEADTQSSVASEVQAVDESNDEITTTESAPSAVGDSEDADSGPGSAEAVEGGPSAEPTSVRQAASSPETLIQVAHGEGFVAVQAGASLAFSADLTAWSSLPDPRPTASASITRLVSHGEALYVAGLSSGGGTTRPWVARSSDLSVWEHLSVPIPPTDDSPLTEIVHTLDSFDVDSTGMIITGETLVLLDVAKLVSAEVLASESWSLGDSQGDLSKIIVYDIETGSPTDEIDLIAEGVPEATLDLLASPDPAPFVMVAQDSAALTIVETDLQPDTVIGDAFIGTGEFVGSGFSTRSAGQVLWSSPDGRTWTELPVSIVGHDRSRLAGVVDDRIVAFTGQGPILTVKTRDLGVWTEARLDRLFGNRNDSFRIADVAFGESGAVAVVATIDEARDEEFHVLVSADGLTWEASPLSGILATGVRVAGIDSIALGSSAAISYRTADDTHHMVHLATE